ncbi:MAG: hypothetical protein ABR529_04460 [Actinomycetota bacterium]
MSEDPDRKRVIDAAPERLELAQGSGGEARLKLLDELYAALELELDADQTPPARR